MQTFTTFSLLAAFLALTNAAPQLAGRQFISDNGTTIGATSSMGSPTVGGTSSAVFSTVTASTPAGSDAAYSTCIVEGTATTTVVYVTAVPTAITSSSYAGNSTDGAVTSSTYAGNATASPSTSSTFVGNTTSPTSTLAENPTFTSSTFVGNARGLSTSTDVVNSTDGATSSFAENTASPSSSFTGDTTVPTSTYVGNWTAAPSSSTDAGNATSTLSGNFTSVPTSSSIPAPAYPACSVVIGNNSTGVTVIYTKSSGAVEYNPSSPLQFQTGSDTDSAVPSMLAGWSVLAFTGVAFLVREAL